MPDRESRSSSPPEWAASALAAEFEPLPRIGALQAIQRYWWLVLAPVVAFVAIAAVVASNRTPTFSAEARLMVGRLNVSTPGAVQGFAQAAQDLAATYPLVIDADGVVDPVAQQLGTTPKEVRSHLSSTQVPSSSIVRVDATGTSAKAAVKLANAASTSLVAFLTKFNQDNPDAARLLKILQDSELTYQRAAAVGPSNQTKRPLSPNNQKLAAALATARVQVSGAASNYQTTVLTEAVTSLLQPITSASNASSDKTSKLEIAILAALLAGLVVGVALATLRANWVARRALTAPSWAPDPSARGASATTSGPVRSGRRSRPGSGDPGP